MRRERIFLSGSSSGFTLLEIMIVVALIAIVAAVAVPSLLRSKINANEAAAIADLRALVITEESFRSQGGTESYTNLQTLGNATPPFIDSIMASGTRHGYTFEITPNAHSWSCNADPIVVGQTGSRRFFVNESGVIRFNMGASASVGDPPLQ